MYVYIWPGSMLRRSPYIHYCDLSLYLPCLNQNLSIKGLKPKTQLNNVLNSQEK